jgi:stringent starvation protein B
MAERQLSRQRPYLLRAMHEWMTDNALTPHIVVDARSENLQIPTEHVRDQRIVLNVSYEATRGLRLGNDSIDFEARFNGVPRSLHVPLDAVLGIYARENGRGMVFTEESGTSPDGGPEDSGGPGGGPGPGPGSGTGESAGGKSSKERPALKVVK